LPADVEICGGTLEGYDRFIEATAGRWGVDLDGWRAHVEVVPPGQQAEGCDADTSCAYAEDLEVSLLQTASGEHELVHLVTGLSGPAFLTEGIATYWGSRPFSHWSVSPELFAPLVEAQSSKELVDVSSVGYFGAAAFTGLLLSEFTVQQYRSFYDSVPRGASYEEVAAVFEDVLGEPMEPFVTRLSTEPSCNAPIWACEHAIPTTLPIVRDGPLDCEDPDVQRFDSDDLTLHAPKQAVVFTLEEDTEVEIWIRKRRYRDGELWRMPAGGGAGELLAG